MPYVLGVDIGSSFVTAATVRASEDRRHPLTRPVRLGPHSNAIPSVVYVAEDGRVLVGDAAERAGLRRPDCVVREFRQRIGDPIPFHIGEIRVAAEDVFATVARWVVDRTQEAEGAPPDAVTLSHPAGWGSYRLALVRQALAGVGLAWVSLLSEPEAALSNYASSQHENPGGPTAVYDLGGSSFQLSIVREADSGGFEVLGSPVCIERLGGADFDDLVVSRVAARLGESFNRNDPADEGVREALSVVRQECLKAKETLSISSEASVRVILPGIRATVRLVRPEFEAMIDGSVRETVGILRQALDAAGLTPDDLTSVLLVGGSSQIPLVARMLADELNVPIVTDPDPVGASCRGAALATAALYWAEESAKTQNSRSAVRVAAESEGKRVIGVRQLAHAIGWPRLRLRARAVAAGSSIASAGARAAPLAAGVAVMALILTVVTAQTTGLGARIAQDGDPAGVGTRDPFLPESLRGEGESLGLPFTPIDSQVDEPGDEEAAPIIALPPSTRAPDRSPVSGSSRPRAPQRSAPGGTKASSGSTATEAGTTPDQDAGSSQDPTPEPAPPDPIEPAPDPVPVPDPDPDPAPDPDPVPVPEPDPVPVPDPNPDPAPDPAPEPSPVPEPPTEPPPVTEV